MSSATRDEESGRVTRLLRVDLPVADLARAVVFYRDGLGFVAGSQGQTRHRGGVFARWRTMRIGQQTVRLIAYDPSGEAYPAESTSADLWFQHIAIVASDMSRAYQRVSIQPGFQAISQAGPQRLPANTGSVTAFKFRDPDGHPLELIHFPQGASASRWNNAGDHLFPGYDHSAICVSDLAQSLRFYAQHLGFRKAQYSLNSGAAQARLDGLVNPTVDVLAMTPLSQSTPHIELLCYHVERAQRAGSPPGVFDVAATQLVLETDDCAKITTRLTDAKIPFVAPSELDEEGDLESILIRDPDGHLIKLEQAGGGSAPRLAQPPVAKPG